MNIVTSRPEYTLEGRTFRGYLAQDDAITGPRPGVIIVHEWWGLNDYIVKRAHKLAELGYVALAIDMYGDGQTAGNPDDAGGLMNAVLTDMAAGTAALRAGYQVLLEQPGVDASRTAAIGYCFGGAMVLHMARIGLPLRAVGSFHGALGSFHTAEPGSIVAKLLVCHGEADTMVTMEDLATFKHEMDTAQADYEVLVLPDAKHGFSNPDATANGTKYGIDVGYQPEADAASWGKLC